MASLLKSITACFVTFIPDRIEEEILYISKEYNTATHLCVCGCGERVVTPLNHMNWTLIMDEGKPTLTPSIGSFSLPCKSHYFIRDGKIIDA
ncbi:MAG: hypothetical protein JKY15_01795 [Deltaproteobacteria bacterium]|nr:hypothetical protein [Deltaproteobacteria bacterium]